MIELIRLPHHDIVQERIRGARGAFIGDARQRAKIAGEGKYSTGHPCKYGHAAKRWIHSGTCVECAKAKAKQRHSTSEFRARNVQYNQARRRADPEMTKLRRSCEAARRRGKGEITRADLASILGAQRGRCAYCRSPLGRRWQLDHIKPLALGGTNRRANLQILCKPCNQSKQAQAPEAFARRLGLLI